MKTYQPTITFRFAAYLLIAGMLHLSTGCSYYLYSTAKDTEEGIANIKQEDYLIIHFQDTTWHLSDLVIDQDQELLSGVRKELSPFHQGHDNPATMYGNRYKYGTKSPAIEVHIYVSSYDKNPESIVSIPMASITQIDIYDPDLGPTVTSYALGTLGVITAAAFVALIIAIGNIDLSSCPFVYIKNGETYQFYGEVYAGAISQNMERDDYMPLPGFEPQNGIYDLKITNELKERQYTDIAELMLVEHPQHLKVMLDKTGKLHTLAELISPTAATTETGRDILPAVNLQDSINYYYSDSDTANPDFSSVHLQFPKAEKADQAKLLIHAKNTLWLDYIVGETHAQFGRKYDKYAEQQKTVPAENKRQFTIDEGMLLEVQVKTDLGWEVVDHIDMVGPLAARNLLIPIDLTNHEGDILDVRLKSGFHFWELDYAAIDYSNNVNLPQATLQATYGIDENGADVLVPLAQVDGNYLAQEEIGNQAFLQFDQPQKLSPDNAASVFLHTRGYYEYIRDYKGRPQIAELKKFREKGTFVRYAREQLYQFAEIEAK